MLRTALESAISAWLQDPDAIEVMLNPDGRLWIDRLREGLSDTGEWLSSQDGERIIRLVAHHVGAEVHGQSPRVSAELPESGERFEGLLPPVVAAPTFAIRKPAVAVFTLEDYVASGIMTAEQADCLRTAVANRSNILVAGWHLHRQDHAHQRIAGRSRKDGRSGCPHRRYVRVAMCGSQPRCHAHPGWRRDAF